MDLMLQNIWTSFLTFVFQFQMPTTKDSFEIDWRLARMKPQALFAMRLYGSLTFRFGKLSDMHG